MLNYVTDHSQQHSVTQAMKSLTTTSSREASPLSAVINSHGSSPMAFKHSPSPADGLEFLGGRVVNGYSSNPTWPGPTPQTNMPSAFYGYPTTYTMPPMPANFPLKAVAPVMTIHPITLKSRVETQIPIKLTLFPLPPGVTRLHLPTETISKPKMMAKPAPQKSREMLELHAMVVCTSAMANPELRRRAFHRAAGFELNQLSSDPDSEENHVEKPLEGGMVKVCEGCINRERKRAGRKKLKKPEEEAAWLLHERKRTIVFNTSEIKEWQTPECRPPSEETGFRPEPLIGDGAMQIDAPMRIACYCRHHNEKIGFQVIFTAKDWQGNVIAQEITTSIMITDDHKNHGPTENGEGQPQGMLGPSYVNDYAFNLAGPGMHGPFRHSHSTSDLQGLQPNYPLQFVPPATPATSGQPSQTTSATMTPRNLSRQASPTLPGGPIAKKRKANGVAKVPSGLAMTKLETNQAGPQSGSATATPSSAHSPSPYTPPFNFAALTEQHFGHSSQVPSQFRTGPPTPNNDQSMFSPANRSHSMENLAMRQMYSAPTSAHPSRVPSPSEFNNTVRAYQQQQRAQMAQAAQQVANRLYGAPADVNPHNPPVIHKLIPSEGPKSGGIEVTCLGQGFCPGIEVMFGDVRATTTTFWSEASLVCLLPPSSSAATVPVTFKHQHQQQSTYPVPSGPKQHVYFKYVDDDEQQMIRIALVMLGHKMTGKMEDVMDLARKIAGDGANSWGNSAGASPSGSQQHSAGFNAATFGIDVEQTLLKILELIDLDDSPHSPRFNLKRRHTGQTMLHMASALGLHRVVAGLLARGAHPDPRDKGGFTPMHFAALHNHLAIVKRLMLYHADKDMRSLQGYTPADMTKSEAVHVALVGNERHRRTKSGGSVRSKASSATSLKSLWEPNILASLRPHTENEQADGYDDGGSETQSLNGGFWIRSRRPSGVQPLVNPQDPITKDTLVSLPDIHIDNSAAGLASPTAAMLALRDQLAAQIQHLQQTLHLALPNLPHLPQMPQMPALPDYQAYLPTAPMVRRISNFVGNRPGTAQDSGQQGTKEDVKWWDLFSSASAAAAAPPPPAYKDIFPESEDEDQADMNVKRQTATQAAAEAVADWKCGEMFDGAVTAEHRERQVLGKVRLGSGGEVSKEIQERLRREHKERLERRGRGDRRLVFVWVSLLLFPFLFFRWVWGERQDRGNWSMRAN